MIEAFAGFLVGSAFVTWILVREGNPRAKQLESHLKDAEETLTALTNAYRANAAGHAEECKRFRCTADKFIADREQWNKDRESFEKDIKAINADRASLLNQVDVARESRDRAFSDAMSTVQSDVAMLRREKAKLETELEATRMEWLTKWRDDTENLKEDLHAAHEAERFWRNKNRQPDAVYSEIIGSERND